jgi:tyrosyl-tRNA synthetase
MNCLDFLRDIGKYFTVNAMLAKDSVKSRIDREGEGMSFTEFSYSLLQGHDFYHLFENEGCTLQIGGSDQWGNMVAGTELIRRKKGESAYVITCPLITRADGTKFGKTASGFMVWLDPAKTSPYAFYQFWINTDDQSTEKYIKIYTFIELEDIEKMIEEHRKAPEKRLLQRTLAYEVTKLIHGEETTKRVLEATSILFGEKISSLSTEMVELLSSEMPTSEMSLADVTSLPVADILTTSGLTKSKSEARQLIE